MAAVVAAPLEALIPGMLVQFGVQRGVFGAADGWPESLAPGGFIPATIRRTDQIDTEPQIEPVTLAAKHIDTSAAAAECLTQIVVGRDGRGKQDDVINSSWRERLGGRKRHGCAGTVPNKVHLQIWRLRTETQHMRRELPPLFARVGDIGLVRV